MRTFGSIRVRNSSLFAVFVAHPPLLDLRNGAVRHVFCHPTLPHKPAHVARCWAGMIISMNGDRAKADNASIDESIHKLKQDWDQLTHPDRALAIGQIKRTFGLSNRKVATMLGRPESSIRRLLLLVQAPAADFAAARQGKISSNELLRRAKADAQRREAEERERARIDQQTAAQRAADAICNWMVQERIAGAYGEKIIDEVRRELGMRQPPPANNLPKMPLEELIRKCKPEKPHEGNADFISWYHQWLFRWTFLAYPDPEVRDRALDLAFRRQWGR